MAEVKELEGATQGMSLEELKAPSKGDLKKQQRAAEKAAKKLEEDAKKQAQAAAELANDPCRERYGDIKYDAKSPLAVSSAAFKEIKDMVSHVGQKVLVRARVHLNRDKGKQVFLTLRQRCEYMQAAIFASPEDAAEDSPDFVSRPMAKFVGKVERESIVDILGTVAPADLTADLLTQRSVELRIESLFVVSRARIIPPFSLDDAARPEEAGAGASAYEASLPRVGLDTRLNNRWVDLRTATNQAIFTVQAGVCRLFREFLDARGFTEIHSPKIIGAASEGGANVFKVSYFKQDAFLAQSPQFYKQMAMCADMQRVYEIAPVFRAENSFTHRHMTEFVGLDVECEVLEHYHEVVKMLGGLFLFMFRELPKRFPREHSLIHAQYPAPEFQAPEGDEPLILPFWEGIRMLREDGAEIGDHEDLSTEMEKRLGRLVRAKFGTDFYILDKYPLAVRPFYTMPDPLHPGYSHSYDFFIRGEEIMSGAQRVHDPDMLEQRARSLGIDPMTIADYINAFRVGAPPHAGGGVGMERVVMLYFDLKNIRKTSLFPRDPSRLAP